MTRGRPPPSRSTAPNPLTVAVSADDAPRVLGGTCSGWRRPRSTRPWSPARSAGGQHDRRTSEVRDGPSTSRWDCRVDAAARLLLLRRRRRLEASHYLRAGALNLVLAIATRISLKPGEKRWRVSDGPGDRRAVRQHRRCGNAERGGASETDEAGDGIRVSKLDEVLTCDLVLLDVTMPEMDGPTMLARMREVRNKTPVLMLTSGRSARSSARDEARHRRLPSSNRSSRRSSRPSLEGPQGPRRCRRHAGLGRGRDRHGGGGTDRERGADGPGARRFVDVFLVDDAGQRPQSACGLLPRTSRWTRARPCAGRAQPRCASASIAWSASSTTRSPT